jgi:hypothetical protein
MKKTIRFWTREEEQRLLNVYKNCKTQTEAARKLTGEFKRPAHCIQIKLSLLLRKNDAKKQELQKGVTIPAGFTFDIKPTRAVMFTDHVRLYF